MSSTSVEHFQKILLNERSFDRLFCDVSESNRFELYYNEKFKDDPVFNHAVIDESIFASFTSADNKQISILLHEIRTEAARRNVPITIFVEDFWAASHFIQEVAVEDGYYVGGFMEILSKDVRSSPGSNSNIVVQETSDLELWNQVFMKSYSIPALWREELARREQMFSIFRSTNLFLAVDAQKRAVGCMLTHRMPPEYFGIYCVGTMPEMRHRGVATAMLLEAERIAASLGCKYLTLQTITSDGVTPLYLELGFKVEFRRAVLRLC